MTKDVILPPLHHSKEDEEQPNDGNSRSNCVHVRVASNLSAILQHEPMHDLPISWGISSRG